MRSKKSVNPADIDRCEEIVKLYAYNLSYTEIENCLGVSCGTITKALKCAEVLGIDVSQHKRSSRKVSLSEFSMEVRQYLLNCWRGDNLSKYRGNRPLAKTYLNDSYVQTADYELADAAFVAALRAYHPERETGIKKTAAVPDSSLWHNGLKAHYNGSIYGSPSASCVDE